MVQKVVEDNYQFFKAIVVATLLYRIETLVPFAPHLRCLQSFKMGCLWVILGMSEWDKIGTLVAISRWPGESGNNDRVDQVEMAGR